MIIGAHSIMRRSEADIGLLNLLSSKIQLRQAGTLAASLPI